MRHVRAFGLVGLAAFALAAVAYAQSTPPATASTGHDPNAYAELDKTHWGDAKAGAAKAGACAACHGLDGNSTANPALYPRIAGQSERYIAKQLALFKSGLRTDGNAALMIPYANALSPQDMRDLGAYFQTQHSGAGVADDSAIASGPYAGKKLYQVGEQLYRQGDRSRGIVACTACHGPDGAGNPGPAYPHIGGQQSWYAEMRLNEYRGGQAALKDDKLWGLMALETKNLSDEEIKGLSTYLQGLHNRADQASPADVAAAKQAAATATPTPSATPQPSKAN
ncbi:c-type cytochrome [Solilutibacter silvestris]|uniref:Cytochrome c n=1 Tax=Solilutibacter silvestris TaxID=1645665 RepID=A0A2K1Q1W7_9GAMM|nr:c-type cytochrome [Lysobacter silvestris]PNS08937.1 Cytochrome c [Lysobacter silvestris]